MVRQGQLQDWGVHIKVIWYGRLGRQNNPGLGFQEATGGHPAGPGGHRISIEA